MPAYFNTGSFNRIPAWHQMGYVSPDGFADATDALNKGKGDYEVSLVPFSVNYNGQTIELPGRFEIVRGATSFDPEPAFFGEVSDRYEVVQNRELAEILNPLTEQYPVDTFGVIQEGRRVFFTLKMPDTTINDDDNERYENWVFVGNDFVDGSLYWMATKIRVVCFNTWMAARQQGEIIDRIGHASRPKELLTLRRDIEVALVRQHQEMEKMFTAMMQKQMTTGTTADFLEKVFPFKKDHRIAKTVETAKAMEIEVPEVLEAVALNATKQYAADNQRMAEARIESARLFTKFNDEQPRYANSLYALAQASNEYVNHYKGRGDGKALAESLIFGARSQMLDRINRVALKSLN